MSRALGGAEVLNSFGESSSLQVIGKEAFYESGVREIHIPDRVERDAIVLPRH